MSKITTLDQLLVWLLTAMRTADPSTITSKESHAVFEMIVQTVMEDSESPKGGGTKHKGRLAKSARKAMKLAPPTPDELIRTVQLVCIAMDRLGISDDFWLKTTKNRDCTQKITDENSHPQVNTKYEITKLGLKVLEDFKSNRFFVR